MQWIGLQGSTHLAFDKVADSGFRHYGNCDGVHDLFDHLGVAHACYAAVGTDVCWDALEGHDGAGTGFFCNAGLSFRISSRDFIFGM